MYNLKGSLGLSARKKNLLHVAGAGVGKFALLVVVDFLFP